MPFRHTNGEEIQRPLELPAPGAFCFAAVTSLVLLLPSLGIRLRKTWKLLDQVRREVRVERLIDTDLQIAASPIDLGDLLTRCGRNRLVLPELGSPN